MKCGRVTSKGKAELQVISVMGRVAFFSRCNHMNKKAYEENVSVTQYFVYRTYSHNPHCIPKATSQTFEEYSGAKCVSMGTVSLQSSHHTNIWTEPGKRTVRKLLIADHFPYGTIYMVRYNFPAPF